MASVHKRVLRHLRIRKKVYGTAVRPRLSIHFSSQHITAQVINDTEGKTITAASTKEKDLRATARANIASAKQIGKLIAERGLAKNVRLVVFDRGGYKYHGRAKALADAVREGGLQF